MRQKSKAGFTLVELMVTMAILGIIMVGVIGLVTTQNSAYHSEEGIIDMQMNNRIALDHLAHIIRMAGFGCQGNINSTNKIKDTFSTIITATNNSSGSDTLTIVSGLRRVGRVDNGTAPPCEEIKNITTIPIVIDDNKSLSDHFNDSTKKYFYISPAPNTDFLTIASDGVNASSLSKTGGNITVTEGDTVHAVKPYTIRLYTDSQGISCLGIDDGTGIDSYAENIEDLQFQYGWDADDNGSIDTAEWVDDPAGNEEDVRAIRVHILARSGQFDRDFIDRHDDDSSTAGKQYTLADHTITLDTNDGNGFDSNFDHHYHRFQIETIVFTRNLNFLP